MQLKEPLGITLCYGSYNDSASGSCTIQSAADCDTNIFVAGVYNVSYINFSNENNFRLNMRA